MNAQPDESAARALYHLRELLFAAADLGLDLGDRDMQALVLAALPKIARRLLEARVGSLPTVTGGVAVDDKVRVRIAAAITALQRDFADAAARRARPG